MTQTGTRENLRRYVGLVLVVALAALIAPMSHYQMSPPDESGHRVEAVHEWVGGWVRVSRQSHYDPSGQLIERSARQVDFQPRLAPLVYLLVLAGLYAGNRLLGQIRPMQLTEHRRDRLAVTARSLLKGALWACLVLALLGVLAPRPVVHEWRSLDVALLDGAKPALAEFAAERALPARVERAVEADGTNVLRLRQHRNLALILLLDRKDWLPVVAGLDQTRLSVQMPMPQLALWFSSLFGLLVFGWTLRQALGRSGPGADHFPGTPASI